MNALLVRVGIDLTAGGWNGPVDSKTGNFVYVPIPETEGNRPGYQKPFNGVSPALHRVGLLLPNHLRLENMHLDPDFDHLTYGDQGERAKQIEKLSKGDLLVFYAGLRDFQLPRLVYAIIGLYEIESITKAFAVPTNEWDKNAHTRRFVSQMHTDIVVRAKPEVSGRLERCLPIGSYRKPAGAPDKRESYRVDPALLTAWGGFDVADGFLQRSARLPKFNDAKRFYGWLKAQNVALLPRNN
jgi:hypothetical protein